MNADDFAKQKEILQTFFDSQSTHFVQFNNQRTEDDIQDVYETILEELKNVESTKMEDFLFLVKEIVKISKKEMPVQRSNAFENYRLHKVLQIKNKYKTKLEEMTANTIFENENDIANKEKEFAVLRRDFTAEIKRYGPEDNQMVENEENTFYDLTYLTFENMVNAHAKYQNSFKGRLVRTATAIKERPVYVIYMVTPVIFWLFLFDYILLASSLILTSSYGTIGPVPIKAIVLAIWALFIFYFRELNWLSLTEGAAGGIAAMQNPVRDILIAGIGDDIKDGFGKVFHMMSGPIMSFYANTAGKKTLE